MKRPTSRSFTAALAVGFAMVPAWVMGGEGVTLTEFSRTGDLLCHLRASGDGNGEGRRGGLMLVIDEVGSSRGAARMVSSGGVGGKPVKVYAGETGVHLVQDVNGSVKVTTLIDCESRASAGRCLRFSAVQAWHFDRGVHQDPDAAFRKLPGTSYAGTCEAWRMDDIRSVGR